MANEWGLNERQDRFARFYASCGNASEAARQAGYKPKYAASNTDKLLRITNVQTAIEYYRSQLKLPTIADMQEINAFWTEVLRDKNERMADRLKAAEARAKVEGAFTEKVDLSGSLNVVLSGELEEDAQ